MTTKKYVTMNAKLTSKFSFLAINRQYQFEYHKKMIATHLALAKT